MKAGLYEIVYENYQKEVVIILIAGIKVYTKLVMVS